MKTWIAIFLAAIATAALAAPVEAQFPKPRSSTGGSGFPAVGRSTPPPSQPALPPQPGEAGLAKHPDLIAGSLRVEAGGRIRYAVENRGGMPTERPFISSVYIGGERVATVPHDPMAGETRVEVPAGYAIAGCNAREVRVIVDEQKAVGEFDEGNNEKAATIRPPCPDLTVTSIHKDWKNMNTMYQVQVTVKNLGNAPTPPGETITIWATAMPQAAGVTGWPEFNPSHYLPPLAPGQETSFRVGGNVAGPESTYVDVFVDLLRIVEETNEDNNYAKKRL